MIRGVIVHIANEQPIRVDLAEAPQPSDSCLVMSNVRTMNGTKPTFADALDSTFVYPLSFVHFIEIPAASLAEHQAEAPAAPRRAVRRDDETEDRARSQDRESAKPDATHRDRARMELAKAAALLSRSGDEDEDEQPDPVAEIAAKASAAGARPKRPEETADDLRRKRDAVGLDGDLLRRIREV